MSEPEIVRSGKFQDRKMEIEDKFEKLRVVGRGAFGVCWLCKKKGEENAEKVIIKMIPLHGLSTKEEQEIKGEADLLRKMKHPMIIGYYDYFTCAESIAIVMQFAEGGTLENLIRDQRGVHFSEATVLKYFTQILLGLEYMHSLNIVHRDLKTQNILLNKKRTLIKLSDFGVSKQLNTRSVASTLIGTPNYLSPEMVEGAYKPFLQHEIGHLGAGLRLLRAVHGIGLIST
uniref:non-specific serine/threonine protein kinase n=1 Tax=Pristionchus pacificus TaxID=54126 RepID=A0A2A6BKR9_PRIPA|eukprot:PDM66487.1 nekl-2 [Pristionchus pacificus]